MDFSSSTLAENNKVLFIIGAYGTKKINFPYLGTQFFYEFINFNKIQVYKGFDLSPTRYQNMNIVQFHITC